MVIDICKVCVAADEQKSWQLATIVAFIFREILTIVDLTNFVRWVQSLPRKHTHTQKIKVSTLSVIFS